MISRGTLIVALVALEFAIVGEMIVAIHGGGPSSQFLSRGWEAEAASGPRVAEGGPHRTFDAGAHPALTVDIGYADLTIITGSTSQIDVAVSRSRDFGFMHSKAPITARKDGDTVHIETNEDGWTTGDMRMVTVVVPPETQVTVANAGDIKATGLRAESSFSSTGRGTVTIDDYNAPALHVTSSNGLVSLHQIVATRLDITSSNDRVEGTGLQVRDGTIESDDRVSLAFATGSDTLVNADANDGKVRLSGFAAGASVETSRKSGDEDDDSSSQIVRLGTGAGHLDVHANDGNITLIQEP